MKTANMSIEAASAVLTRLQDCCIQANDTASVSAIDVALECIRAVEN